MADSAAPSAGRVFISYRREETAYAAGWLFDRLVDRFGRGQIFKDIDSIQLGDDFVEVITAAVGSCDVLLALIGARWLTIADEQGRVRLDDPDDFVRLEIEAALTRNVRVIPILVDGARMPRPDQLPASLAKLVRRHALELSPGRFDFDVGRLHHVLDSTLADVHAPPAATEPDLAAATGQTSARALYVRAGAEMRLGHFQTAIDLFDELLAVDPNHPDAAQLRDAASRQLHLAEAYQRARDAETASHWTDAANGYAEILDLDPTYRDAAARHQACQTRQQMLDLQGELRHHAAVEGVVDPVSLIVAALAAGAAAGGKDVASSELKNVYNGLTALLVKRFRKHTANQPTATPALPADPVAMLEAHETKPDSWKAPLEQALKATGADQDQEILAAAKAILEQADPQGAAVVHVLPALSLEAPADLYPLDTSSGERTAQPVGQPKRPPVATVPPPSAYTAPTTPPAPPRTSQPYRPPPAPPPPPVRPNYAPGAGAPRSQPRHKALVAAVALLVVVAGICVGLVVVHLANRTSACPTQALSASATQRYSGPGPVTVIGPAGWANNSGEVDVQDFNPPGSTNLATSPYMRIGIANRHPKSSMKAEADATALAIIHTPGYRNVKIVSQRLCRFLGTNAADFEYTGVSDFGVPRHGIERRWTRDGTTRTLEYATPASQWSDASVKFFYGLADNTRDR
jgi:tetratricopeptide (TPR) repeat protein